MHILAQFILKKILFVHINFVSFWNILLMLLIIPRIYFKNIKYISVLLFKLSKIIFAITILYNDSNRSSKRLTTASSESKRGWNGCKIFKGFISNSFRILVSLNCPSFLFLTKS